MKFKIGDKVRVRKDLTDYSYKYRMENSNHGGWVAIECMCALRGKTVTISGFNENENCYYIEELPNLRWTDEMFEGFMEEKKVFTKSDLKNGDVIKKRNGNVEIVVLPIGTLVTRTLGYNVLKDINEDLTSKLEFTYDIVSVRRPKNPSDCSFSAFEDDLGELVYNRERDEKSPYNGKVVCVDLCGKNSRTYTVGKIYEFKDGVITTDDGWKFGGVPGEMFYTFEDWTRWTASKFIEVVE